MADVKISAATDAATVVSTDKVPIARAASTVAFAATAAELATFVRTGTTTNDNAPAGLDGEYIASTVAQGSAVSLTTATPADVTSVSLTAGDWDVRATLALTPGATTSITAMSGGISSTSATLPGATSGALLADVRTAFVPNAELAFPVGVTRLSLASTTTVYLVAQASFTVSTLGAYGGIFARRVR